MKVTSMKIVTMLILPVMMLAGCKHSSSPIITGTVLLQVKSSGCGGTVWWRVGDANNYPNGENVSFPWTKTLPGVPGDDVYLGSCVSCYVGCTLPCFVAIESSIYWNGTLLTSRAVTGTQTSDCEAHGEALVTLPE